jgi:hypothetical protein
LHLHWKMWWKTTFFFHLIFKWKKPQKMWWKMSGNLNFWFPILHYFSLTSFHQFCYPFSGEKTSEKGFTFFTIIFRCKWVWIIGVTFARKAINFISNFSPCFQVKKVVKKFYILHICFQCKTGGKSTETFTHFSLLSLHNFHPFWCHFPCEKCDEEGFKFFTIILCHKSAWIIDVIFAQKAIHFISNFSPCFWVKKAVKRFYIFHIFFHRKMREK